RDEAAELEHDERVAREAERCSRGFAGYRSELRRIEAARNDADSLRVRAVEMHQVASVLRALRNDPICRADDALLDAEAAVRETVRVALVCAADPAERMKS